MPKFELDLTPEQYEQLKPALEGLGFQDNVREVDGSSRDFLDAFAKGIEQLKKDSPDMASRGGGAKARIEKHLEVLKRTNDELSGRDEGGLKELFDRADQIMDKPIYQETPTTEVKTESPLKAVPSLQIETGRATTDRHQANTEFYQSVSEAALKHGVQAYGISKVDLEDGMTLTAIDGEVIISQDNGQGRESILYEQSPDTAHLSGMGYDYTDKLDRGQKTSILEQVQELGRDSIDMDAHLARDMYDTSSEVTWPPEAVKENENERFFNVVHGATESRGQYTNGLRKLDLGDGMTAIASGGEMVISKADGNGNELIIYEQSRSTASMEGVGETHLDKIPQATKNKVYQRVLARNDKSRQNDGLSASKASKQRAGRGGTRRRPRSVQKGKDQMELGF